MGTFVIPSKDHWCPSSYRGFCKYLPSCVLQTMWAQSYYCVHFADEETDVVPLVSSYRGVAHFNFSFIHVAWEVQRCTDTFPAHKSFPLKYFSARAVWHPHQIIQLGVLVLCVKVRVGSATAGCPLSEGSLSSAAFYCRDSPKT